MQKINQRLSMFENMYIRTSFVWNSPMTVLKVYHADLLSQKGQNNLIASGLKFAVCVATVLISYPINPGPNIRYSCASSASIDITKVLAIDADESDAISVTKVLACNSDEADIGKLFVTYKFNHEKNDSVEASAHLSEIVTTSFHCGESHRHIKKLLLLQINQCIYHHERRIQSNSTCTCRSQRKSLNMHRTENEIFKRLKNDIQVIPVAERHRLVFLW